MGGVPELDMPRLSLCLIARDEAQFIERCIASVVGVADEVVVCDTGSADDTVALACAAGARVVHHVWRDDFSAARNVALEAATGDWVLVLDADEVLAPGAGAALLAALDADELDCGLLPLHHADGLDAAPLEVVRGERRHQEPTALARLFRRTPGLAWEGMIHESPSTWLAVPGRRVGLVRAQIVHYGNIPDIRESRRKADRNLRLLERACRINPDDIGRLTYLARERWRAGDGPGAVRAVQKAWNGLAGSMEDGPRIGAASTVTLHVYLLLAAGKVTEARHCLELARGWGLAHPNLVNLWAAALVEQEGNDPAELRAALSAVCDEAIALAGQAFADELLPGATGAMAHRLAGELCILLGEATQAEGHLRAALQLDPGDVCARLAMVEALMVGRRSAQALQSVEPLLQSGLPDAWLLVAEAAAKLGQREQLGPMLKRAAASEKKWIAQRRAARLGRRLAEHRAWRRLKELTSGRPPPPHPNPQLARQTATEALAQRRIGLAMQLLPQVLAADPGDAGAWAMLATAAHRQGATPLADDLLQTARGLSPHHPLALGLLVEQAEAVGNVAAARTWRRVAAAHGAVL